LSFTGQCAETIQETIGAHYTLKIIQKENGNGVSKAFCAVSQKIFTNLFITMDKEVAWTGRLLRNSVDFSSFSIKRDVEKEVFLIVISNSF
jgi:hypothetical protein